MSKNPSMALVIGTKGKGDMSDNDKGMPEFDAPQGYDLEGKKPGDEIEFVGKGYISDDGKICLTHMDGMDLGEGKDDKSEEEEGEKKPYGDLVSNVMPGADGEEMGSDQAEQGGT